jgi:uncharacterized integral membrane protein
MSDQNTGSVGRQGSVWTGRLIGAGVILFILLLFVALNSEDVEIDMLFFDADMRLGFALLLAGALGFLVGFLMPRGRRPN